MGNWNRRWVPRKKYNYKEPSPSPPRSLQTESSTAVICENNVPSWERNFCISVGIPWQKVVVAKKYMYCHDNVLKWNDSAGEEAFHMAKKRFWAKANGLRCDTVLPDPDTYIDVIDWNPDIDPQLMLDLDREYFNPDEAELVFRAKITNENVHNSALGHALGWDDKSPSNGDNPWECLDTVASKAAVQGWSKWDNSMKLEKKVENPWEHSCTLADEALRDNAWGGLGGNSLGWKQGLNHTRLSKYLDSNHISPWECGRQNVQDGMEQGWGDAGNNSWSLNRWGTSNYESRNLYNGGSPWKNNFVQCNRDPKQRGWKGCSDSSWGWKQWENQINGPDTAGVRALNGGPNEGGRVSNGGYRKREGSQQFTSRYKTLRFHGDNNGINHQWRQGRI